MISKGDLVKVRLSLGGGLDSGGAGEILILGRMMNYSEEEDMYILEPKAISISKDQVVGVDRLLEDFDFDNISEEMGVIEKEREREIPPDITNIRISRGR